MTELHFPAAVSVGRRDRRFHLRQAREYRVIIRMLRRDLHKIDRTKAPEEHKAQARSIILFLLADSRYARAWHEHAASIANQSR